jgi:hypothetical protein
MSTSGSAQLENESQILSGHQHFTSHYDHCHHGEKCEVVSEDFKDSVSDISSRHTASR